MSNTATMTRKEWLPCLIAAEQSAVVGLADQIQKDCTVRNLALPASGLGVLTMQDGAFNESYFLGEFPLAQAHVELTTEKGETTRGAAHVMSDDQQYARALAILDAALIAGIDGAESIQTLVAGGQERRAKHKRERKAILARTRVDFAELSTADGDDGDDN